MKWNETAFWRVCKYLKMWWPGTESNRRRQPFQGRQINNLQVAVLKIKDLRVVGLDSSWTPGRSPVRVGLHLDSTVGDRVNQMDSTARV